MIVETTDTRILPTTGAHQLNADFFLPGQLLVTYTVSFLKVGHFTGITNASKRSPMPSGG